MANITQHIPSYTGGISEQPDELKIPGQVNKAKNVLPDVVEGLLKRPGGKLVGQNIAISQNFGNNRWFSYYRDENEQYIGQINQRGQVDIWRCSDGVKMPVTNNLETLTQIDNAGSLYAERDGQGEWTITIPNHQFKVGELIWCTFDDTTTVPNIPAPNNRTVADGVYEITDTTTNNFKFKDNNTSGAISSIDIAIAQSYLISKSDEDLQTLTLNDFTYITNRNKTVAMSTDKSPVKPSEAFIQLKKVAYANQYAVNLFDLNTTQDVTTATRISILSSRLNTDGTCPNVGTEILNVGTGSDYAFDIKNEFIFKALHGNHEGGNNFFETDLTLGYQLHYCPPEWTANTFYRPGDLVTGRPDAGNNDAHQSVYQLKAGSTARITTTSESIPSHESGDGSTVDGHTWTHVSVEIYEADNDTFEDTSGSGSGATSQIYDNKPCITLSTDTAGLDVDSQADFEALIAEWKNTTINPGYTHLPFVFDDQENFNESAAQNHAGYYTETAEFGIVWKHFGYYDDHINRIILVRPGGTGGGQTIGGSTVDLVTGVGQIELKTEGWATDDTVKEGRSDLYFRLNVTGQAVPTTTGTGSNATTTYSCRYTTTVDLLHGGSGWQVGDKIRVPLKDGSHVIQVDAISTAKVQANLGLIRPTPTSFDTKTTVTAESILGDLQTDIIAASTAWTAWPSPETASSTGVKIIGNGIYIRRSDNTNPFNISTPNGELLNVLSDEVKDIADLPEQCRHGYIVKVANSENVEDDYYVKFLGQLKNGGDENDDND